MCATITLNGQVLDWLVRLGWVQASAADDPKACRRAVGEGVSRLLEDAAKRE
jgi:hypothetical protein